MKNIMGVRGFLLFVMGIMFSIDGCKETSQPLTTLSNTENTNPNVSQSEQRDYSRLQSVASDFAKVLAYDLNKDASHRKEVFSKIADQFDGTTEMLVQHLSDKTISELESLSQSLAKKDLSYREIKVSEIVAEIPDFSILMPKMMKGWTDKKIEASGGIVVAYFPFGQRSRDVKELTGFDKIGNKSRITRENSKGTPFLVISVTPRVNNSGNLRIDVETSSNKMSHQGENPKYFPVCQDENWKNIDLVDLNGVEKGNIIRDRNRKPVKSSSDNFLNKLKRQSALYSSASGGEQEQTRYYGWYADYLKIDGAYDPWYESDIEVYFYISNNGGYWWANSYYFSFPDGAGDEHWIDHRLLYS
jgi:hypothetical protein